MSQTIFETMLIMRSTTSDAPLTLQPGELAFSYVSNSLFIGDTAGGVILLVSNTGGGGGGNGGSVTLIQTGVGLNGGPISGNGTISANLATTGTQGVTKLIDSIGSSDTSNAATANSVTWALGTVQSALNTINTTVAATNTSTGTALLAASKAANTVAVLANGVLAYANANVNFNNTSTINVSVSQNGTLGAANVAFSLNTAALNLAVQQATLGLVDSVTSNATLDAATANSVSWAFSALTANINLAFAAANSAQTEANTVYAQANTAYGQANLAYAQANLAATQAAAGQNTVAVYANDGLIQANSSTNFNNSASINVTSVANTLTNRSNISFSVNVSSLPATTIATTSLQGITKLVDSTASVDASNAATANAVHAANVTGQTGISLAIAGNLYAQTVQIQTAAAYTAANTAQTALNVAYATLNTAYSTLNTVYTTVNAAYIAANTAQTNLNVVSATANAAYAQANAAFNKANSVSGGGSSANGVTTYANSTVVIANANINFINTSTVNVSALPNVALGVANLGFSVNISALPATTIANASAQGITKLVDSVTSSDTGNAATANAVSWVNNTAANAIATAVAGAIIGMAAYNQANLSYSQANNTGTYANGTAVLANVGNLNFNNTATINVSVTANGSLQSNISFTVNTSAVGGNGAGILSLNNSFTVYDTFQRANGPNLGTNWAGMFANLNVTSNTANTAAGLGDTSELWSANTFGPDQFGGVQIISLPTASGAAAGVFLRGSLVGANGSGYRVFALPTGTQIVRWVQGFGFTQLANDTVTWANNDFLYAQMVDSVITVYRNNVILPITATDTTLTNGAVGIGGANSSMDNWFGGQFSYGPTATKVITTTSNNNTLTSDRMMTMTLQTGRYRLTGLLMVNSVANGAGGFQFDLFGGTAPVTNCNYLVTGTAANNVVISQSNGVYSTATVGTTTPSMINIDGYLQVSNTGTVVMRWSQAAVSANLTSLMQGSHLVATLIG